VANLFSCGTALVLFPDDGPFQNETCSNVGFDNVKEQFCALCWLCREYVIDNARNEQYQMIFLSSLSTFKIRVPSPGQMLYCSTAAI
jgi:hypothetical protein